MTKVIPVVLVAFLLSGCIGNHFLHVEPDPEKAAPGYAYVDFYHPGAAPAACKWQVYQVSEQLNSFGRPFTLEARMDAHVYLAEIAAEPHRLVRVEVVPGARTFKIGCGFDKNHTMKVEAVDGMVVPVRIEVVGSAQRGRQWVRGSVEQALPYRRKQDMPYAPRASPG